MTERYLFFPGQNKESKKAVIVSFVKGRYFKKDFFKVRGKLNDEFGVTANYIEVGTSYMQKHPDKKVMTVNDVLC